MTGNYNEETKKDGKICGGGRLEEHPGTSQETSRGLSPATLIVLNP